MKFNLNKRDAFLTQIIIDDYACYVYKSLGNKEKYIIIRYESNYQYFGAFDRKRAIFFSDNSDVFESRIYFSDDNNSIEFDYSENTDNIDKLLSDIDVDFCLKLLDVHGFIRHFHKLSKRICEVNNSWETINYLGLLIRHQYYYRRYSDFGFDNYKISILGNPIYISPYKKIPFEFDFFDGGRTHFWHFFPREEFNETELKDYSAESFTEFVLEKAFGHFFDKKKYLAVNYDDIVNFGYSNIVLPKDIEENSFLLSVNHFDFYK